MENESAMEPPVTIRPFNGSLADAEGLLAVERATFDESPYTAAEVQVMLDEGPQRAWLAVRGECVAGFAIGFPVSGLRGSWWEVDLLAVHPEWRGRRLGHRLIEATMAYGADVTRKARAVVADDNSASEQAFLRAGFRVSPGARELFIFRPSESESACGQRARWSGSVREAAGRSEVTEYLASRSARGVLAAMLPDAWGSMGGSGEPCEKEPAFLVAEQGLGSGELLQPAGYAELIEVQTLLYRGTWIESLQAASNGAREALVERAVDWVCDAGLDEIGVMVHEQDWATQKALRRVGFRSLGGFRWLVAQMPHGSALP
jgi:ribosomal protein S18 acetylase RimI-like enzyme